jgi:hypothetical protein
MLSMTKNSQGSLVRIYTRITIYIVLYPLNKIVTCIGGISKDEAIPERLKSNAKNTTGKLLLFRS